MALIYVICLLLVVLVLLLAIFPIGLFLYLAYKSYNNGKTIRSCICASFSILYVIFCITSFFPRSARHVASDLVGFRFSYPTHVIEFSGEDFSLPLPGGRSDGAVYVVLQLSERQHSKFLDHVKGDNSWSRLPMPDDMREHSMFLQPTILEREKNQYRIPINRQNGFYRFIDYQVMHNIREKSTLYDTNKPFYQRNSYNFLFALYDQTTYQLYIYELNT